MTDGEQYTTGHFVRQLKRNRELISFVIKTVILMILKSNAFGNE